MAGNRQRGLLQVATNLPTNVAPQAGNLAVPSSGGAQAHAAVAAAHGSIASQLAGLSSDIGRLADHAAKVEGTREGHKAGLDPEFRPRRDMTIRGEAYDAAGLKTAANRVRIEVENDIETGGNLAAKRQAWLKNTEELPELQPEIDHMFRRGELAHARKAAREHEARIRSEALGTLQTSIDTSIKGLHQRAYALGLDAKADEAIGGDLAILQRRLSETGPDGKPLIAPAAAAKLLSQARETVVDARLLGAFERLPDNAARVKFIERIEEDFKASKGLAKHYDLPGFQRITGQLQSHLRASVTQERQALAGVREEVKQLGKLVENGNAPNPAQLAAIRSRATAAGGASPELSVELARLEDLAQFQGRLRGSRVGEIDAFIRHEQAQMTTGATPISEHRQDRLKLAMTFATNMRKALKDDMLGWAERVGQSRVSPLVFEDRIGPDGKPVLDETKLLASFKARIVEAEDIAKFHGLPPQYLRPQERARFGQIASQGGGALMGIAKMISDNSGDDPKRALAIFGEVFKEAPTVATIGGLVSRAGAVPAARDAADGVALSKTEGFKSVAPSADRARMEAQSVHGGVLSGLPETEQALINATNKAYEVRARRQGVTDFDNKLWKSTFREMLGERNDGREVYGGIVYSRPGRLWGGVGAIVIPPDVKQSQFPALLRSIEMRDFGDNPPRYAKDGKAGPPVTIADFRNATLEQAGNGRYFLNLGDADAPQYLIGRDNQPYVLDLEAMEGTLRGRVPDAYLGGGPKTQVKAMTQTVAPTAETRALTPVIYGGPKGRLRGSERVRQDYDGNTVFEISDETAELGSRQKLNDVWNGKPVTLGEVLQHHRLFQAYPQLKGLSVRRTDDPDVAGRFTRDMNGNVELRLNPVGMDQAELLATILHEAQHAVDDIEGRAGYNIYTPYEERTTEQRAYATEERQEMTQVERDNSPLGYHTSQEFIYARRAKRQSSPIDPGVLAMAETEALAAFYELNAKYEKDPETLTDQEAEQYGRFGRYFMERYIQQQSQVKAMTQTVAPTAETRALTPAAGGGDDALKPFPLTVPRQQEGGAKSPLSEEKKWQPIPKGEFDKHLNEYAKERGLDMSTEQGLYEALAGTAIDRYFIELTHDEIVELILDDRPAHEILNGILRSRGDAEGNKLEDARTPAAKQGMISGTAAEMPALKKYEGAMGAIRAFERGNSSAVTPDDYARMMPLMQRVFESDGMDREAAAGLEAIFKEIEGRK